MSHKVNAFLVMVVCIGLAVTIWLIPSPKIIRQDFPYPSPSPYPVPTVITRTTIEPGPTTTVRATARPGPTVTARPQPGPTVTVTPKPSPTCFLHQLRKCP